MYPKSAPTKREVHDLTHAVLQTCLKLTDYSRKFSANQMISVLLFGVCQAISLSAACRRLASFPSDETVRKALVVTLPEREELETRLNAGLANLVPKALRKGKWPIAIDYCDLPYYGKKTPDVRRGRAQRGTTRYHTYATAFVVRKGYRFTLAATWVSPDDSMIDVLERLLERIDRIGVKIRFLLMDRGFYEADVLRYLKQAKRPYLILRYASILAWRLGAGFSLRRQVGCGCCGALERRFAAAWRILLALPTGQLERQDAELQHVVQA
jgi:hypothetical protein